MKHVAMFVSFFLWTATAQAAVKTETLEWMGLGPYAKWRAEQVATLGYVTFAAGVDYRLIEYPGAVHSFTVREASDNPSNA